jgi:hypothetical protein
MKYSLYLLLAAALAITGCQKELSFEKGDAPDEPSKEVSRKYQLRDFYSDIPVDFDEQDDIVKSETELWSYVKEYIKDDIDEFFNDSTLVRVYQNDMKMPGNDEAILDKFYAIGTDSEGQYMSFIGPDYEPLKYRLQVINEDYFIIYVKWRHGATIYSRFERIR